MLALSVGGRSSRQAKALSNNPARSRNETCPVIFVESGNGIFLHGQTYHLQPADVAAQIEGDMSLVRVHVVGKFLRFDTKNLSAPGVPVFVKGTVLARVEMK